VIDKRGSGAVGHAVAAASLEESLVDAWLVVEAVPERLNARDGRADYGQIPVLQHTFLHAANRECRRFDIRRRDRPPRGPFEMMDQVGLDVVLDIEKVLGIRRSKHLIFA
jgi:hypothetical protein